MKNIIALNIVTQKPTKDIGQIKNLKKILLDFRKNRLLKSLIQRCADCEVKYLFKIFILFTN